MKNLTFVISLILVVFFTSCKKSGITPGNYKTVEPTQDTSKWQSGYNNGGVLPTNTATPTNNDLVGTKWVLIDVYHNYASVNKKDTVRFITNTKYTVNSDTTKYTYYVYSTMGNSSMTINTFIPINGLTLSCSNFNATAFKSTPIGGTIQLTLKDNFTTSNNVYTSTFKKI